jgi:hypothetical protein
MSHVQFVRSISYQGYCIRHDAYIQDNISSSGNPLILCLEVVEKLWKVCLLCSPVWGEWLKYCFVYIPVSTKLVDEIPVHVWCTLIVDVGSVQAWGDLLWPAFGL